MNPPSSTRIASPPRAPYAVVAPSFRFPALAALAGRTAIGGQREVALAAYLAARLAQDALPDRGLSPAVRAERASGARSWLSTLSLPQNVRTPLAQLMDASAQDVRDAAAALRPVMAVTASYLDRGARSELQNLASMLEEHALKS